MQFNDDLRSLRGAVQRIRPSVDSSLADTLINYRMRQVIDARPYWSGLISQGILDLPTSYSTGSIALVQGSATVVGSGAVYPVADVVNTTIPAGITNLGYQVVTPASMVGITSDTLLYVDAAGTPEVVPVVEISQNSFKAKFNLQHNTNCTATTSSFAYRQLAVGNQYPVYTVTAVVDAGTFLVDPPWAGIALTGQSYEILQAYSVFSPDIKDFISVVDPQTGQDLELHYPKKQLDWDDPQRSSRAWPQCVSDLSAPNLNGNAWYEIWPWNTSQRQLYFTYIKQVPDMKAATDRPMSFVDPSLYVLGAVADAFRIMLPGDNPSFNIAAAEQWEQKFQVGLLNAMASDVGKNQSAYTWSKGGGGLPGGANFWQSHDPDVWGGNY